MNLGFHFKEVIEMKKILSIIVVGLMVFMGSAASIQHASAVVLSVKNTPSQMSMMNNSPPTTPVITGPANGKHDVSYNFTFTSTDPDGDNVFLWIEWGDGCPSSGWLGPYHPGEPVLVAHTFPKGTWTISCQAKDIYNATSDWGTLKVSMPLSNALPHMGFLENLLARFPNAFPILRHLLSW
jgi:hypothetical protein